MACNRIPQSYPSLVVHITEAEGGAERVGSTVPLLINTVESIGEDRAWLLSAQQAYRAARAALVPLRAARRTAMSDATEFAAKARGVLEVYLGRDWSEAWLETGWVANLAIPVSFDELYELSVSLKGYFTAHPAQTNEVLGVTLAAVSEVVDDLTDANDALNAGDALQLAKRDVKNAKQKAVRKRLSSLCKELSVRLEDMDPRWRDFGFNMPGAATVPEIPEDVVVTPLPAAKLQIACASSANATSYRFYVQRVIIDPEPIHVGTASDPLFVTESLVAAQPYVVYVSAVNEGAESDLSDPVGATPVMAAAA